MPKLSEYDEDACYGLHWGEAFAHELGHVYQIAGGEELGGVGEWNAYEFLDCLLGIDQPVKDDLAVDGWWYDYADLPTAASGMTCAN